MLLQQSEQAAKQDQEGWHVGARVRPAQPMPLPCRPEAVARSGPSSGAAGPHVTCAHRPAAARGAAAWRGPTPCRCRHPPPPRHLPQRPPPRSPPRWALPPAAAGTSASRSGPPSHPPAGAGQGRWAKELGQWWRAALATGPLRVHNGSIAARGWHPGSKRRQARLRTSGGACQHSLPGSC